MLKLIRLTEIVKDGEGTKSQPILINSEIIATVTTGDLEKKTVHIIGEAEPEKVTFIQYRNNSGTFVAESLEQVAEKVEMACLPKINIDMLSQHC